MLEAVSKALSSARIDAPFSTAEVLFHDRPQATNGNRIRRVVKDVVFSLAIGRTHSNDRAADADRIMGKPVEASQYEGDIF